MNSEAKLPSFRRTVHGWRLAALTLIVTATPNVLWSQQKTDQKPNILVIMGGAVALVAEWLQSFKEFPPRQKPASFNLDEVMQQVFNPGPGQD